MPEKKQNYRVKYARIWEILQIVKSDVNGQMNLLPVQIDVKSKGVGQALIDRIRQYYAELQADTPELDILREMRPVLSLRMREGQERSEGKWFVLVSSPKSRKGYGKFIIKRAEEGEDR